MFDLSQPEEHCVANLGFKKVSISAASEKTCFQDNTKCMRKQHELRHHATGTMRSAIGDARNKWLSPLVAQTLISPFRIESNQLLLCHEQC